MNDTFETPIIIKKVPKRVRCGKQRRSNMNWLNQVCRTGFYIPDNVQPEEEERYVAAMVSRFAHKGRDWRDYEYHLEGEQAKQRDLARYHNRMIAEALEGEGE